MQKKFDTKSIFKHDCSLSPHSEGQESLRPTPFSSRSQKLFFSVRRWLTIKSGYEAHTYFHSRGTFYKERNRHLKTHKYRYIIHPFSTFMHYEKMTASTLTFALILMENYIGSFLGEQLYRNEEPIGCNILTVCNFFMLVDIILKFFVGFPVDETQEVILEQKQIVKKYLKLYFFIDFIPTASFFVFRFIPLSLTAQVVVYELHKIRIFNLKPILDTWSLFLRKLKIGKSIQVTVLGFICAALVIHMFTCLLGLAHSYRHLFDYSCEKSLYLSEDKNLEEKAETFEKIGLELGHTRLYISLQKYFLYFALVLSHFVGCKCARRLGCSSEVFLLSIVLIVGCLFQIGLAGTFLTIFGVSSNSDMKYEELVLQVDNYLTRKHFPKTIKKQIFIYYKFKYNMHFFSEQRILDALSHHIRLEVLLYSCKNLMTEVKLLKNLSKAAVGAILTFLKQEIYVPGQTIMSTSIDDNESLYFILYGTCGILLNTGKELLHVYDGDSFGTGDHDPNTAKIEFEYKVEPLEPTEVYIIKKQDLLHCCALYPEIKTRLASMVKVKAKEYRRSFWDQASQEKSTGDILEELNRGKILHRGIKKRELDI